jgi:hypothetical protein
MKGSTMSVQNSFAVVLGHRLTRGARVKLSRLATPERVAIIAH